MRYQVNGAEPPPANGSYPSQKFALVVRAAVYRIPSSSATPEFLAHPRPNGLS